MSPQSADQGKFDFSRNFCYTIYRIMEVLYIMIICIIIIILLVITILSLIIYNRKKLDKTEKELYNNI